MASPKYRVNTAMGAPVPGAQGSAVSAHAQAGGQAGKANYSCKAGHRSPVAGVRAGVPPHGLTNRKIPRDRHVASLLAMTVFIQGGSACRPMANSQWTRSGAPSRSPGETVPTVPRLFLPNRKFGVSAGCGAIRQRSEQAAHARHDPVGRIGFVDHPRCGARTTSGLPQTLAATTGVPQAINSSRTFAQPSREEASTDASAAPYRSGNS